MSAGRKTKLTREMIKTLCALKQKGLKNNAVCDFVEICEATFYKWYDKGLTEIEEIEQGKRTEKTIFSEFVKSYKKAESIHKLKRLKNIEKAGDEGSWTASAWEMERCYPNEYGRRVLNQIAGQNGEPIKAKITGDFNVSNIDLSSLSDEDLKRFDELIDKINST